MSKKLLLGIALIIVILGIGISVYFYPKIELQKNTSKKIDPVAEARRFDVKNAMNFTSKICKLGPRYGGNKAELEAANLLKSKFKEYGLNTSKEKVNLDGGYTYNVIGEIKGSEYPNRYIIIGSHIDSPGFCEGATDDAAALGIQVEVARILKDCNPKKSILIIGFGGEEQWFKGSEYFVKKHPDIVKNCDAVIDLNCVGSGENVGLIKHSYLPSPVDGDPNLINVLKSSAEKLNHGVIVTETTYPSDTYPFYKKNVPVCQVMSQPFGVSPWSSENTFDKLNSNDIKKIGETLVLGVLNLSNMNSVKQVKASYVTTFKASLDDGCSSILLHVNNTEDIFSYRRDAKYKANIYIEKEEVFGKNRVIEYKTNDGRFYHSIITEDGWIVGIGGRDSSDINDELRTIAETMMDKGIQHKYLKEALEVLKSNGWGHLFIKAPDNTVGVVIYDYRAKQSKIDIFKIKNNEFVVVPNNPKFYVKGKFKGDPIFDAIDIAHKDPYGIHKHDIITYDINGTNLKIFASQDGFPDNIIYLGHKIPGKSLPKAPEKKMLGEIILKRVVRENKNDFWCFLINMFEGFFRWLQNVLYLV